MIIPYKTKFSFLSFLSSPSSFPSFPSLSFLMSANRKKPLTFTDFVTAKETLICCSVLFGIASVAVLLRYSLKRKKTALDFTSLSQNTASPSVLHGITVVVNDSDNLRFYHTPCLLSLWHFLTRTKITAKTVDLRNETVNVRLAGIDAPELAHFGMAEQPYAREAKEWLRRMVEGKRVRIKPLRIDQYQRLVANVWVRKRWLMFFWWSNVSLEMVHNGFATIYKGCGAEYDGMKGKLEKYEEKARRRRLGMWQQLKNGTYVSPSEHKNSFRTVQN